MLNLFRLFGFDKMFWGCIALATNVSTILFLIDRLPLVKPPTLPTPAKIPLAGLVLWTSYACFRHILFVVLSVLVPVAFWIVHAAIRSRGFKNKVSNKMEQAGAQVYAQTLMGYFLAKLGYETKDYEE